MKRLSVLVGSALVFFGVSALATAQGQDGTVEITLTAPVVVGETEQVRGRLEQLTPEAQRLGVNSIRLLGSIAVENSQGGESRLGVSWTEVSIDNQDGESVSATLEAPLESRFRTLSPAIRAGNKVRARGDLQALGQVVESLVTGSNAREGEDGRHRNGNDPAGEQVKERDLGKGNAPAAGSFKESDPNHDYLRGGDITPAYEPCAPDIDQAAGKVTPMSKRIVLDGDGNVVGEGSCVASGPASQIETDYSSCPIHIDHKLMTAYRTYRKYAVVDGRQMEVQGCTVDVNKELERVRDFASCSVIIPEMVAGGSVYPAYRWISKDRDNGKDYVVSDCLRDLESPLVLEAQTGVCGNYISTRQDGRVYPMERLIYMDNDGVEHEAVGCRRVDGHPGFAVITTHEGCGSTELEGTAGKIIIRPQQRQIFYDADGVQREARSCEPTASTQEVFHRVIGWKHHDKYSELMTEKIYDFEGETWYWNGNKPSVFARVEHEYRMDGCSDARHDTDAHITLQETRTVLNVTDKAFDPVRSQLEGIEPDGVIEAFGCNSNNPLTIPHIKKGWTDWVVVSSSNISADVGNIALSSTCDVDLTASFNAVVGFGNINNNDALGRYTINSGGTYKQTRSYENAAAGIVSANGWSAKRWTFNTYNNSKLFVDMAAIELSKMNLGEACSNAAGNLSTSDGFLASGTIPVDRGDGPLEDWPLFNCSKGVGCSRGSIRPFNITTDSRFELRYFTIHSISTTFSLTWRRAVLTDSGASPFPWAHSSSPWDPATGCTALGGIGGAAQRCQAKSQTRERYEVWSRPVFAADGSVSEWEDYADSSRIDRQVNYLINL